MKINGCGLDVVVSQQFLYRVQVCSLFQQVCGKGVAQHVYVYTVFDACTMCGFFQHFHQCTCRNIALRVFRPQTTIFVDDIPENSAVVLPAAWVKGANNGISSPCP